MPHSSTPINDWYLAMIRFIGLFGWKWMVGVRQNVMALFVAVTFKHDSISLCVCLLNLLCLWVFCVHKTLPMIAIANVFLWVWSISENGTESFGMRFCIIRIIRILYILLDCSKQMQKKQCYQKDETTHHATHRRASTE